MLCQISEILSRKLLSKYTVLCVIKAVLSVSPGVSHSGKKMLNESFEVVLHEYKYVPLVDCTRPL